MARFDSSMSIEAFAMECIVTSRDACIELMETSPRSRAAVTSNTLKVKCASFPALCAQWWGMSRNISRLDKL
jgi:hypothetical protein